MVTGATATKERRKKNTREYAANKALTLKKTVINPAPTPHTQITNTHTVTNHKPEKIEMFSLFFCTWIQWQISGLGAICSRTDVKKKHSHEI